MLKRPTAILVHHPRSRSYILLTAEDRAAKICARFETVIWRDPRCPPMNKRGSHLTINLNDSTRCVCGEKTG